MRFIKGLNWQSKKLPVFSQTLTYERERSRRKKIKIKIEKNMKVLNKNISPLFIWFALLL